MPAVLSFPDLSGHRKLGFKLGNLDEYEESGASPRLAFIPGLYEEPLFRATECDRVAIDYGLSFPFVGDHTLPFRTQ